ncbi:unnamed protein product, partial [Urochloa humidicola]
GGVRPREARPRRVAASMACEPAGPASALSIRWPWQRVATREQAWAHGGGDGTKAAERELKRFFLDSVNCLENPSRN